MEYKLFFFYKCSLWIGDYSVKKEKTDMYRQVSKEIDVVIQWDWQEAG